jgi:WD40 repeat protein
LAVGDLYSGNIQIWATNGDKPIAAYTVDAYSIKTLLWPNSNQVLGAAIINNIGTLHVYGDEWEIFTLDLDSRKTTVADFTPQLQGITSEYIAIGSPTFSPDHSRFAYQYEEASSRDLSIVIADVATTATEQTIKQGKFLPYVSVLAWSPDGSKLLATGQDMKREVWDVSSGQAEFSIEDFSSMQAQPIWTPDGEYILLVTPATTYSDEIKLFAWDGQTGENILDNSSIEADNLYSLAFNLRNNQVVLGGDFSLSLWQFEIDLP